MRKIYLFVLSVVLTGGVFFYSAHMKNEISSAVLRLHVVANSDSEFDQALKLKVRNAILDTVREKMSKAEEKDDAVMCAKSLEREIILSAQRVLRENGTNYPVSVSFGKERFPTKKYQNLALPTGIYDAVKVKIGKAEGKNWWCVLYPPLCLTDGTCLTTDDAALRKLKNSLTDEEFRVINQNDNDKISLKFKILELF